MKITPTRLLDMVLPPRCPMTGTLVARHGTLSPEAWSRLNFIPDSYCHCCGGPFRQAMPGGMVCAACLAQPPLFSMARAALRYDDGSAPMILKFKHADGTHLAPLFGNWLLRFGHEVLAQSDVLIPVPLHRWRLLKRRYNQAALLASVLSRQTGLAHAPHVLRRARHTPSQGNKTRTERADNIKQAFAIRPADHASIASKRVLLIDDVYTSGATVHECSKTLLAAGATQVNVLTIARAGFAA